MLTPKRIIIGLVSGEKEESFGNQKKTIKKTKKEANSFFRLKKYNWQSFIILIGIVFSREGTFSCSWLSLVQLLGQTTFEANSV